MIKSESSNGEFTEKTYGEDERLKAERVRIISSVPMDGCKTPVDGYVTCVFDYSDRIRSSD